MERTSRQRLRSSFDPRLHCDGVSDGYRQRTTASKDVAMELEADRHLAKRETQLAAVGLRPVVGEALEFSDLVCGGIPFDL